MRIPCTGEVHPSGGPGSFYLVRAEALVEQLLSEYEGKVQLIYLDPPFGTGDTFHVKLPKGQGSINLPVYADTASEAVYEAMMETVLRGCKRLLKPSGSIYLHVDYRKVAPLRQMMNRIFGERNFLNEIIWAYRSGGRSTRHFPRKHDNILFYRKSDAVYFNIQAVGKPRGPEKRNHMKRFIDEDGRICFSIRSGGKTYYYYEDTPVYPTDVWTDIEHLQQRDKERVGYATQKPEALLNRIILASSKPNDLVLDLFSGSGTTASVAMKTGRRFLAGDISAFSLNALRQRLIQNAALKGLADECFPLTLHYPDCTEPATLHATLSHERGRTAVTLTAASFDGAYPLSFCALGTMQGDVFHVASALIEPKLPCTLTATSMLEAPAVLIVDAIGRRACFSMENG